MISRGLVPKRRTVSLTLPTPNPKVRARKQVWDPFYASGVELCNFCVFAWNVCLFFLHSEQLMKPEEKGSGAVAWSVYGAYIKAAGGPVAFIINVFFFLSTTGSIAFSNWWLSHWIRQGSGVSLDPVSQWKTHHLYVFLAPNWKDSGSVSCGSRLSINLNVHD